MRVAAAVADGKGRPVAGQARACSADTDAEAVGRAAAAIASSGAAVARSSSAQLLRGIVVVPLLFHEVSRRRLAGDAAARADQRLARAATWLRRSCQGSPLSLDKGVGVSAFVQFSRRFAATHVA